MCDRICEFCGALFWFSERQIASPLCKRPKYTLCCRGGVVALPFPSKIPDTLLSLLSDSAFMTNIRAYNSMFAMTSFGASVDESVNAGKGSYVFKVGGQISHWIGSLCPAPANPPRFMQMYVYDTQNEVENRLRQFQFAAVDTLSVDIVAVLQSTLDNCNELVKLVRTARDLCSGNEIRDFSIRIYQGVTGGSYAAPNPGSLAAIVTDTDPVASAFDIVIHNRHGGPQRVSKLHPSYMSLQYPLLFPPGQPGWSPDLKLRSGTSVENKRLTMNMFYCYLIHDRANVYAVLLDGGRLFQQYLVDAYLCIEQNRLEYIRTNQNVFRTEVLSGVHDALSMGDTEGSSIGRRILLPSSFTGSPRYMYKHYQDALAICRIHGNPQYFVTFTCNEKWPEITKYKGQSGILKNNTGDRPDIIARVFRLKVQELVQLLRNEKPFGVVAAGKYFLILHILNYRFFLLTLCCLTLQNFTR
jgi:hypothetical protein